MTHEMRRLLFALAAVIALIVLIARLEVIRSSPNGVPIVWAHGSASRGYEIRAVEWFFDRQTPEQTRRQMADPLLVITGATEFDVFLRVVGNIPPGDLRMDWLFDMLFRIGPSDNGEWTFLPGYDRMMGSSQVNAAGVTRPQSGHNIFQSRPDWFVRDAAELLDKVIRRRR